MNSIKIMAPKHSENKHLGIPDGVAVIAGLDAIVKIILLPIDMANTIAGIATKNTK